jgi:hypothetical protein
MLSTRNRLHRTDLADRMSIGWRSPPPGHRRTARSHHRAMGYDEHHVLPRVINLTCGNRAAT